MAFEAITAQIELLLDHTQENPEGLHAIYQKVMQEINGMKAFGMPMPVDLIRLEQALEQRFANALGKTESDEVDNGND
jgi:hypothetical protein